MLDSVVQWWWDALPDWPMPRDWFYRALDAHLVESQTVGDLVANIFTCFRGFLTPEQVAALRSHIQQQYVTSLDRSL